KNRYPKAWDSMIKLRHNPIQAARDIYYIHSQLVIEKEIVGKNNYVTRFAQLFTIPRIRRASLAAFTVMIAQQVRFQSGPWCVIMATDGRRRCVVLTSSPSIRLRLLRSLAVQIMRRSLPLLALVSSTGKLTGTEHILWL